MEGNRTIDIHYNKLLDWLLSRRHCKSSWRDQALVIRGKINNAIQDMPATEELTELLRGTYINYFHCLRIVELLKETEAGTRNIFGRYGSQRMKDWQEVVRLYEKDDVYLAEAAQLLARNVSYEVPSLKKQISKCKQTQNDCSRKQSEYSSLEAETKDKFSKKCRQMGIKGERVKSELLSLVRDLPNEFDNLSQQTSGLDSALNYYINFRKFVLEREKDPEDPELLPTLRYVQNHGNTTLYQLTHGRKPDKVIAPEIDIPDEAAEPETEGEIDWGTTIDIAAESADTTDIMKDINEGAIDFGDADAGEIDWGGIDLNLDIQIEDGGLSVTEQTTDNEQIQETAEEGVAVGQMALTVLDNVETRTKFMDDLYELDAFLMMRVSELQHTGDVITAAIFDSAPTEIQLDLKQVQHMREKTQTLLTRLNDPKLQMMMSIRSSTRFVEKLSEAISSIELQAQKFAAMQRLMVNKRNEALEQQSELEPQLDLIRQKTMVLKKQIENEISKKYDNRTVNIMGEINVM